MFKPTAIACALGAAFAGRRVHKRYEALVHGRPAPPASADGWGEPTPEAGTDPGVLAALLDAWNDR